MPCPPDMVDIGICCMDRYEASRKDATGTSAGADESQAMSRAGVLPWHVNPMTIEARDKFQAACAASGKRLCRREEFLRACQGPGPDLRRYFFGGDWNPETCNSVDAFCDDYCREHGVDPCNTNENCGYQYYCFHVMPTGSFPGCTDGSGLFDVNGNVWEIVPSASARGYEVRGGAFNCGAPSLRFECTFDAGWNDLFAGFRCCRDRAR
jgi:formylglycine-generating enzyme required for sulfatase activity